MSDTVPGLRETPALYDSPQWHALNRAHTIVAREVRTEAQKIIDWGSSSAICHEGLQRDLEALSAISELLYIAPALIDEETLDLADRALALPVRNEGVDRG